MPSTFEFLNEPVAFQHQFPPRAFFTQRRTALSWLEATHAAHPGALPRRENDRAS